jgi:glycerol-3-phosphate dehydrogenase (NAD(P)+)
MKLAIAGAGAFGTALAVSLSRNGAITLWARDPAAVAVMHELRQSPRLPDVKLPEGVSISADAEALSDADVVLLAIPAQKLRSFLNEHRPSLSGKPLVACGKGIDLATLQGPTAIIEKMVPDAVPAMLTGPSFAADIARGLPTALTLACGVDATGQLLQQILSSPNLRLYRTTDTVGAELGGALKNVMAIACGACMGAGLGDSARAALMTRGFAELVRLAARLGAMPETLSGLSGFGDLVLTCTSAQSRNFAFGLALGRGEAFDANVTVEGVATAEAVVRLAANLKIDLPISAAVAELTAGRVTVLDAMNSLLNRPLKEE